MGDVREETYHNAEGEHVGGRVHRPGGMGLGTAPHPVAGLLTNDGTVRGDICAVLQVRELDLLHGKHRVGSLDEDVVRLNVCAELGSIHLHTGLNHNRRCHTSVDDSLLMQCRKSPQGVFQDALDDGEGQVLLRQA